MKVLFITNYPSPYRVDFFNLLGKNVDLTVSFTSTPEQQKHRSADWFNTNYKSFTPVFLNQKKKIGNREFFADIFDLIKQTFDIIVFGGYSSLTFMLAIEYLRIRKIPFYIEADGGLIRPDSKMKYLVKKHFISSASGWLSSGTVTNDYFVHYGAKRELVYQYPFTSQFQKEIQEAEKILKDRQKIRTDAKKKLEIKENITILSIGQFIHRKGLDILIKSANYIDFNIGIYIIGGTPTEEYQNIVAALNLKNIHFVGFKPKSELSDYYKAADIFVMPTREDIWGLVINEALSYGLPIVSTDKCVAGLELIQNGKNGYIVPVEDSKALADGIAKILKSDMASMSFEAYQSIQNHTIENMVKSHLEIFNKIIKARGIF